MATFRDIVHLAAALELGLRLHLVKTKELIIMVNPN